jgi:hypothetical protein
MTSKTNPIVVLADERADQVVTDVLQQTLLPVVRRAHCQRFVLCEISELHVIAENHGARFEVEPKV